MTHSLYLSIGSNLGDREDHVRGAVKAVGQRLCVTAVSSIYETDPVGVPDQPAFLNLVVAAATEMDPVDVLGAIKEIEHELGRRPTFRWGPRAIDIDILLYDDLQLETVRLTIPHREMINRAFVLAPLAEIAPDVIHPVVGLPISALRDRREDLATVRPYREGRVSAQDV